MNIISTCFLIFETTQPSIGFQAPTAMATSKLLCIGYNWYGEFGLGHAKSVTTLTEIPNKSITKVFTFANYSIFSDDKCSKLLSAGQNDQGQLGIGEDDKEEINTPKPITYFEEHGIIIKKICQSVASYTTFFISNTDELYGCGGNLNTKTHQDQDEPKRIEGLSNVIDAQSSHQYLVALCSTNNKEILIILSFWCSLHQIPDDIMKLLLSYTKSYTVYSTTNEPGSGHPKDAILQNKYGWNEILLFKERNINIIKIAISNHKSFFLDDTGSIWVCGSSRYLGIADSDTIDTIYIPTEITYFKKNNIMIKDIQCGYVHNLALTIDGKVYAWGANGDGQCGFGSDEKFVEMPRRIEFFDEYIVESIKCGWRHNWIRTECGADYMFGDNGDNECIKFGDNNNDFTCVLWLHRIEEIVKHQCKVKYIIGIALGCYTTQIIYR